MELLGVGALAEGLSVQADRLVVAPGEAARIRVVYEGGGPLDEELCFATNDPTFEVISVALHTGERGQNEAIGEAAPDFALRDLDGSTHRLSEQLGHPVVLAYFATW